MGGLRQSRYDASQLAVSQTFRPFELYTAATAIYLVLTLGAARMVSMLEQRYRY